MNKHMRQDHKTPESASQRVLAAHVAALKENDDLMARAAHIRLVMINESHHLRQQIEASAPGPEREAMEERYKQACLHRSLADNALGVLSNCRQRLASSGVSTDAPH